jgi:ferredoxin
MCLYWGISPYYFESNEDDLSSLEVQMIEQLKKEKLVVIGDKIVITHGDGKYFKQDTSNSIRAEIIKDTAENILRSSKNELQEVTFSRGKILLDTQICAGCQVCVTVCPHNIWATNNDEKRETYINIKNAEKCTLDMQCVEDCPTGAIEIIAKHS